MKALPALIKWSGSKRSQAEKITSYFPKDIRVYYEPFLGSGSVLGALVPRKAVCGDVCKPLIQLWKTIQIDPDSVIREYEKRWDKLQETKHYFFYKIRDNFNKTKSPHDFLFLTRTCVNGLIRFNNKGEFNNSFHHSRKGIHPSRLKRIISLWSSIIKEYNFHEEVYYDLTKNAENADFIYLDPPYLNTRGRYFGCIDYDKFIKYLEILNKKGIKYALSFDGIRGEKSFIVKLPKRLYKKHILIHSGNSTFNKIQNNRVEKVYESLYLNY